MFGLRAGQFPGAGVGHFPSAACSGAGGQPSQLLTGIVSNFAGRLSGTTVAIGTNGFGNTVLDVRDPFGTLQANALGASRVERPPAARVPREHGPRRRPWAEHGALGAGVFPARDYCQVGARPSPITQT